MSVCNAKTMMYVTDENRSSIFVSPTKSLTWSKTSSKINLQVEVEVEESNEVGATEHEADQPAEDVVEAEAEEVELLQLLQYQTMQRQVRKPLLRQQLSIFAVVLDESAEGFLYR